VTIKENETMKRMHASLALVLSMTAALALGACNKQPESTAPEATAPPAGEPATPPPAATPAPAAVSVQSVDLGTAVSDNHQVSTPATTFKPDDTIYASVNTTGSAASATLSAKWSYQDGQTVNESSTTIAPTGDASTAFHINTPDGLPAGNYKVDISLNGAVVATKSFTVQ
jgi:hypothetical protein